MKSTKENKKEVLIVVVINSWILCTGTPYKVGKQLKSKQVQIVGSGKVTDCGADPGAGSPGSLQCSVPCVVVQGQHAFIFLTLMNEKNF